MSEGWIDEPFAQSNAKDVLSRLIKNRERVHSSKTRSAYKRIWLFPKENFKVGTTYVVSEVVDMRLYRSLLVHLVNLDVANDLLYKIEACVSPDVKWEEIQAETTITHNADGNASDWQTVSDEWAFIRVHIKSSLSTIGVKVIAGGRA